jgi:anti-sigma B factor antagonist
VDAYLSNTDSPMITVRGEIDLSTSGELLHRLLMLTHQSTEPIALDLSRVTFMDCAGLHVLAAIERRVRHRGGTIEVTATSLAVARLFELAGYVPAARAVSVMP